MDKEKTRQVGIVLLIMSVILISTFFDGIRDNMLRFRCKHEKWWEFHIAKWISFYSPLLMLLYLSFKNRYITFKPRNLAYLTIFIIINLALWKFAYNIGR